MSPTVLIIAIWYACGGGEGVAKSVSVYMQSAIELTLGQVFGGYYSL